MALPDTDIEFVALVAEAERKLVDAVAAVEAVRARLVDDVTPLLARPRDLHMRQRGYDSKMHEGGFRIKRSDGNLILFRGPTEECARLSLKPLLAEADAAPLVPAEANYTSNYYRFHYTQQAEIRGANACAFFAVKMLPLYVELDAQGRRVYTIPRHYCIDTATSSSELKILRDETEKMATILGNVKWYISALPGKRKRAEEDEAQWQADPLHVKRARLVTE